MAQPPLNERLDFYGIAAQDPAYASISRAIGRRMEHALAAFYEELARRPELSSKFADAQMMERARRAQAQHWRSVFDAGVTESFRERSAHIGAVHARIELEPKYYVGSYARILDELITELIAPGWQRHLPWKRAEARRVAALVKVSLLDIEVALSSYFFDLKGKVTAVTEGLSVPLDHLAHGRLAIEPVKLPPEYAKVAADFNATIGTLKDTVAAVIDSVSGMTTGSREICSAAEDLSRRTEEQAANLEEAATSIAQTTARVKDSAATAAQARDTIAETTTRANDGARIVSEAVIAMSQIEKSSQEITNIIAVIDSIAFQTNLLALNAGVEAARAGETGKGFAVVASEVRALAQRCAQAAEEVKALISVSGTHVSTGVDLVSRSGDAFAGITRDVADLSSAIQTIAESARLQAEDLSQINTVVGDLDRSTQQNAAMAEQCTAAATSLVQEAAALSAQLAHFDVGRGDAAGQFGGMRRAGLRQAA